MTQPRMGEGGAQNLTFLLDPRSIVIIGASNNFERAGGIPVKTLLGVGYPKDRLLLVNPRYAEIAGLPCYPDVASLPWTPDLAVIAVRASETLPALKSAHEKGVRAAVLFASGFAEEHSAAGDILQQEISAFGKAAGMAISGPNCLGHANFRSQSFATFLKGYDIPHPAGPIGIITQSGNMAAILMAIGRRAGLAYSYFINTGNEACLEFSKYLEYLANDPATSAVMGYVEQLRDGGLFLRVAAQMRAQAKPLFILKVGTSDKAAEAAASHTAAMAGDARVYKSVLRQVGAAICGDPGELIDLTKLSNTGRRPVGRRTCIVSISGAGCAILADRFADQNIEIPTLPLNVQEKLRAVLPSYGMWTNPVDLTGQVTNDISFFRAALTALIETEALDCVVFYIMGYLLDLIAPELIAAAARTGKLLVVIDTSSAPSVPALEAAGIVVFLDIRRAALAVGGYLDWSERSHAPAWTPAVMGPIQEDAARPFRSLNETEAKQFLKKFGLPVVDEVVAASAEEAVSASRQLGFPVAIKVLSADILHKTDAGGVRLNIQNEMQARAAFDSVTTSARRAHPDARIDGVTVQQQINGGVGVLLGITRDPVFGPIMTVGLGGILTELFEDIAIRALPVDTRIANDMLRELKCFPLLNGFRGAPPCDQEALIAVMVKISNLIERSVSDILDLEINPILVQPKGEGVVIVDALLTTRAQDPGSHLP